MSLGVEKLRRQHLDFIYQLTQVDQFCNADLLSQCISLEDKPRVTHQTIKNWFSLLRTTEFSYYPKVFAESLGLTPVCSLSTQRKLSPKEQQVFLEQEKYVSLTDTRPYYFTTYLYPTECLKNKDEHETKKVLLPHKTSLELFMPFHKYFDENGHFLPEHTVAQKEILQQIQRCKIYCADTIPQAKKMSPLLIPIAFESYAGSHSSEKILQIMQQKLGDEKKNYFRKRTTQDTVAVKEIQKTIRMLNDGTLPFMLQTAVRFSPLKKSLLPILFEISVSQEQLYSFVEQCLYHSIKVEIIPLHTSEEEEISRKYFIRILSDHKGLAAILAGKEESIAVKHILLGSETSEKQDFNYAQLYDPVTKTWKTSLK